MAYKKFLKYLILFGLAVFLVIAVFPFRGKILQVQSEPASINQIQSASSTSTSSGTTKIKSSLGIGLNGLADYSTQLPFLDGFKTARPWLTQCVDADPGCNGQWDTDEGKKLDLDANGWVKSLPAKGSGATYSRVGTLLFRDIPGKFPTGSYVVLYEGEGTITYSYEGKKIEAESKPGRDVIEVSGGEGGIWLQITATDPNRNGKYIRNIRVVQEKYEQNFASEIFNPVWLEKIKGFSSLRFMDWMSTNNSTQKNWEDRPKPTDYSWSPKGAPVETMVALVNHLKVDAWFNMPHMATDDYVTKFAQYVKDNLDPKLTAYVEYSNEVWNWQFQQATYAKEQGAALWGKDVGDAWVQWNGMKAAQFCDIWKGVFGNQKNRVFCVIGAQTGWKGLEEPLLNAPKWVAQGNQPPYKHGIDGLAITGYFSGNLGQPENTEKVLGWSKEGEAGFKKAFQQIKDGSLLGKEDSLNNTIADFEYFKKVADSKGLQLVAYEGGSHIVGIGDAVNNAQLTKFLIEVNKRPEMYEIYTTLLNAWKEKGGSLFNHFVDVGLPGKWGSWGALESLNQSSSPRYNALIDFIKKNPQS